MKSLILLIFCILTVSYSNDITCLYTLEEAQNALYSIQESLFSSDLSGIYLALEALPQMSSTILELCEDVPSNGQTAPEDLSQIKDCTQSTRFVTEVIDDLYMNFDLLDIMKKLVQITPKFQELCLSDIEKEESKEKLDAEPDNAALYGDTISDMANLGIEVFDSQDLAILEQVNKLIQDFMSNGEFQIDYRDWMKNEDLLRKVADEMSPYIPDDLDIKTHGSTLEKIDFLLGTNLAETPLVTNNSQEIIVSF